MRELCAIKVTIGLKKTGGQAGHHEYPNFGQLPCVMASGMDWSRYVDVHGEGWQYDKVSGHRDDDADSPFGQQSGVLIVPADFAEQAAAAFPGTVERLTEPECKKFYEDRVTALMPAEVQDAEVLQAIAAKRQLGMTETAADRRALNPSDPAPGIRTNPRKKWTDFKKKCGMAFKEPA